MLVCVRASGYSRWGALRFQAYYILDEVLIGGHLQDVNKREILRVCAAQDDLMEEAKDGPSAPPR